MLQLQGKLYGKLGFFPEAFVELVSVLSQHQTQTLCHNPEYYMFAVSIAQACFIIAYACVDVMVMVNTSRST